MHFPTISYYFKHEHGSQWMVNKTFLDHQKEQTVNVWNHCDVKVHVIKWLKSLDIDRYVQTRKTFPDFTKEKWQCPMPLATAKEEWTREGRLMSRNEIQILKRGFTHFLRHGRIFWMCGLHAHCTLHTSY